MANDPAQDRYNPPAIGSEFEEDYFSEINPRQGGTGDWGKNVRIWFILS